jgi:hypothetical protein
VNFSTWRYKCTAASNAGVKPKLRGTNDESNVRRVVHGGAEA